MLKEFFWMCSGADTDLLSECPKSEQIKFAGIGGTIFFTALLATIASAYALFTVFDNIFIAIVFGMVWGFLIFNLDRFIVSSLKKREDKMDELLQAAPRIVLALIIAVVISKPLELKIFEKEIDRVLLEQKNEMTLENQGQVAMIFDTQKQELQRESTELKQDIALKSAEVNALYDVFITEAEGTSGTGRLGKGPVYKEKREKHDAALKELGELKVSAVQKQAVIDAQLAELDEKEKTHLAETQPIIDGFDGLMARIGALAELPWMPSFFIFLLFVAIETSPIMAKLMTPKGEYDIKYGDAEDKLLVWALQKKQQRQTLLNADKALNKKVYESIKEEEETYHYKKQRARELIRFQTDKFVEEQIGTAKG
ncbi:MAG: DUF4407 domain-containing protein [Flavobacteriales bacterium]